MVDIEYKPLKKVVITECVFYSNPTTLAESLKNTINSKKPTFLSWAEGVLFRIVPDPIYELNFYNNQSKRIDNKEEFWVIIAYAADREYKQSISIDNLEIPIVDVTPSDSLKQIAIWIKENHRNNGNDNGKSIIRKPKKKEIK